MTLWEIDQGIMACLDAETGEIIDPEMLTALSMEREAKLENVACWIKNLRAEAAAIKVEKDALAKREKAAAKKAEDLENWLVQALGGQAFNTAKCAVGFRKSSRVDVLDKSIIPEAFMKAKTEYSPDKNAIAAAIKAGQEVSGCVLTDYLNISIN